jgi:hypothetical protein
MKEFEYKVIELEDFSVRYRNNLNEYGKDGWELISVQSSYGSSKLYYFKREKQNKKEGI